MSNDASFQHAIKKTFDEADKNTQRSAFETAFETTFETAYKSSDASAIGATIWESIDFSNYETIKSAHRCTHITAICKAKFTSKCDAVTVSNPTANNPANVEPAWFSVYGSFGTTHHISDEITISLSLFCALLHAFCSPV